MSKEKNVKKSEAVSKEQKGEEKKSAGQRLADKLFFIPKNCWEGIEEKTEKEIEAFARSYREILDRGKTEREFSCRCRAAEEAGLHRAGKKQRG